MLPNEAALELQNSAPLYKQVEKQIMQCLAEGVWKAGDRLPTESELSEQLGVAVFTIRAGIRELVSAGMLIRKQGKGTFVARHTRQRQRYQFSHVFDQDGKRIQSEREIVGFKRCAPSEKAAAVFGLSNDNRASIYNIGCLLTVAGRPFSTMDISLPVKMFEGLTAAAIREGKENLYAVYQDVCGINVIRMEERIYAAIGKPAITRTLKIPPDSPILCVERISYTYNDVPVEFRARCLDAGKYHYRASDRGT